MKSARLRFAQLKSARLRGVQRGWRTLRRPSRLLVLVVVSASIVVGSSQSAAFTALDSAARATATQSAEAQAAAAQTAALSLSGATPASTSTSTNAQARTPVVSHKPATAHPTKDAWSKAALVVPTRVSGERASACQVRRIGEWLNVTCPTLATSALTQLGGSAANVKFELEPAAEDGLPRAGELSFPLYTGDRRAFSFWTVGEGYDGPLTVIAAVVLQVDAQSEQSPIILLHDALNEPIRTAQSERRHQQQSNENAHAPKQP